MIAYWDTSALLPLLLQEPHTPAVLEAAGLVTLNYSWDWMRVEAEAAMRRRNAPQPAFKSLQVLLQSFHWLSVTPADYEAVCSLNSRHRLRAADAGHLFCLHRAAKVFPEIQLVGFDHDLAAAARMENLNVWSPA
jgi:hypothetical protein